MICRDCRGTGIEAVPDPTGNMKYLGTTWRAVDCEKCKGKGRLPDPKPEPLSAKEYDQVFRQKHLALGRLQGTSPAGRFWYSPTQARAHDLEGRDRTFFYRWKDQAIVEYTELVDFDALQDDPLDKCTEKDGVYLGEGVFHHAAPRR